PRARTNPKRDRARTTRKTARTTPTSSGESYWRCSPRAASKKSGRVMLLFLQPKDNLTLRARG
ncbi:MAG: hypothetical protein VX475_16035, partial [Myxococcota bacterium]|nr:hypothetical protein [Myxococcota bacterium]